MNQENILQELRDLNKRLIELTRILSTNSEVKNVEVKEYELLLDPRENRNTIFPIKYNDIWDEYLKHNAAQWPFTEVRYTEDLPDWENKLNDNERFFLKMVLAFFSQSDKIVNEKEEKDESIVTVPECKFYIDNKKDRENTHTSTYLLHLETLVKDKKERDKLFDAVNEVKSIKNKADWCRKYITDGSFVQRQVAFAITEGLFFSSSFCAIFWFKKRGLMPAICFSNELISRDEGSHRDYACLLYRKYIRNKLPEGEVVEMIKTAVKLEQEFVKESLPVSLIGMNADLMCEYVEYVADILCMNLLGGEKKIYNKGNPFSWMLGIDLDNKANFFERPPSNYMEANLVSNNKNENEIRFDADF